jgi:hypothetical protein
MARFLELQESRAGSDEDSAYELMQVHEGDAHALRGRQSYRLIEFEMTEAAGPVETTRAASRC